MSRATVVGLALAALALLVLIALAVHRALEPDTVSVAAPSSAASPSTGAKTETHPTAEGSQGYLHGRITTVDGATYEGRLRWGRGGEEAFWGDYFNGAKTGNPWATHVPAERLPKESHSIEIFRFTIGHAVRPIDLGRLFMARFGDIARIEAHGRDVRVTLKSGSVFDLDRFEAGDFDDDVRVWDGKRGVVDFDSRRIQAIELLPTPTLDAVPSRLHGTVRTRQGDFKGFLQWDREECVGTDALDGHSAQGELEGDLSLPFDTIHSIARRAESSLVTLQDGREIVLSGTNDVGPGNRGIYVDDPRYGRVLIAWDAFERVDFSPGGSGPAYGDFPPGRPLTGSVTTRAGRRLAGRLVYDLDESETTETLDAPAQGVDYTIPFGLIASIVPGGGGELARVTLHDGEKLELEPNGDLGERNAGLLIFVDGREPPEYVTWTEVAQVDFERPQVTYPPLGG